ncbi:MAG: glycosyltransferase family 4 protein [Polyangia bacterium]
MMFEAAHDVQSARACSLVLGRGGLPLLMPTGRRIAIVSPNLYPRVCGVGDNSFRLGQELMRRGESVELFARAPAESHPEASNLPAHGAMGVSPFLIAVQLERALRRYAPTDVIIQYTGQMWDASRFGSPAVAWLAARLKRSGARITLMVHEPFIPPSPRPDLALGAALQRLQMLALLRRVDRVFVSTDTRARALVPYCRIAGAPAPEVVRIGPSALPVPRVDSPEVQGPRLGTFSTAGVGKRFDVVLEAFAMVAERNPGAELVLIGDLGPPDSPRVREVQEWVAAHPARSRIRQTGKLGLGDIAREVAMLDIYLFPMDTGANSRSSTLPLALGTGLPVVAISGAETDPDLFRDGENILFAPELAGRAFGDAALRLIADPPLRLRLSEGARQLYEREMGWGRVADVLTGQLPTSSLR